MNKYEIHKHGQIWVLTCETPDGIISTVTVSGSKLFIYNTKIKLENQQCQSGSSS